MNRAILFLLITGLSVVGCKDGLEEAKKNIKDYPETQSWWNDRVFYQLFVRSFYDSDGDGNGDLQGVIEKLDYLNDGNPSTEDDLGVTALMLMPVFQATGYDGYDVEDYLKIDPDYGTIEDLKRLLEEAQVRGIKVVIDFPVNQTSAQHPWFIKASSSDPAFKNRYIWRSNNPGDYSPYGGPLWHPSGSEYYYGLFGSGKPDLNFKNEDVTADIKKISEYWINETGVSGFRMEAAGALIEEGDNILYTTSTLNWWRDYFGFVRKADPSFLLVGDVPGLTTIVESYADDRLDFCFEYELSAAIFNGIKNQTASVIREKMVDVINRYPTRQYGVFLTNQFQNRTIDILDNSDQAKAAAGVLFTLPGVPFVYYGEEIAMKGGGIIQEVRRPMQWSAQPNAGFSTGVPWYPVDPDYLRNNTEGLSVDENSILSHYKKLIKIRQGSAALNKGSFEPAKTNDGSVLAFFRTFGSDVVLVVQNLSSRTIADPVLSGSDGSLAAATYSGVYLPSQNTAPDLIIQPGGGFVSYTPEQELGPYSTTIIRFTRKLQ